MLTQNNAPPFKTKALWLADALLTKQNQALKFLISYRKSQ